MSEVEQVIDIRDPEINVEEIMNRIRERIQQRRVAAKAHGLDYDRLVDDKANSSGPLPTDLYYDLHQLRASVDGVWVTLAQRDRKFPIFNSIFFRIENLLHRLVVKYVNMLAGRQTAFNRESVNVLSGLAQGLEDYDLRLNALEKRIGSIEEQLKKR